MKITKGVISRLQQINKEAGLSNRKFSMSLGHSAATIQEIYAGRVKTLSGSIIMILEMKYGVNIEWLKTGKGPKKSGSYYVIDSQEVRMIENYRAMPADQKKMYVSMSDFFQHFAEEEKSSKKASKTSKVSKAGK